MQNMNVNDWCTLPSGRLLYQTTEEQLFVVVESRSQPGYWIVANGWETRSKAAGPFHSSDILRAYRLANTLVPEGCELGPWQWGLGLFHCVDLPGQADDWSLTDVSCLTPSVSYYTSDDVQGSSTRACCAPPTDSPRLAWVSKGETEAFDDYCELIRNLSPNKEFPVIATLSRSWNVHPLGSPLFAENTYLEGIFLVIDLPSPVFDT